jgi:hypothetical protein
MKKIFMIAALAASLCLSACGSSAGSSAADTQAASAETEAAASETEDASYQTLLDDSTAKIEYVNVFEANGLQGDTYMTLKVKNNTDEEITVSLEDAEIEGESVTVKPGSDNSLAAGKETQMTFLIKGYTMMQFEELTCKINIQDKSLSTIEETDPITIIK